MQDCKPLPILVCVNKPVRYDHVVQKDEIILTAGPSSPEGPRGPWNDTRWQRS